jgi:hypothetical protein
MKFHANRFEHHVLIPSGERRLNGILRFSDGAVGVVVLAHAGDRAGFATLLIDLRAQTETEVRSKAADVELLAYRLQHVAEWLAKEPESATCRSAITAAAPGERRRCWRRPAIRLRCGQSSPAAANPTWTRRTCGQFRARRCSS